MPAAMPRRRQTQPERVAESTQRLLDAAVALISDKGFERITAGEIAEAAGYSREMVRLRYGSKDGLLQSLLATEFEPRLLPADDEGNTGLEQAVRQFSLVESEAVEHPALIRAFFVIIYESAGALSHLRPWLRDWTARYLDALTSALRRGQRDGSVNSAIDPEAESRRFLSEVLGRCFRWTVDVDNVDITAELREWQTSFVARVGAREHPTAVKGTATNRRR